MKLQNVQIHAGLIMRAAENGSSQRMHVPIMVQELLARKAGIAAALIGTFEVGSVGGYCPRKEGIRWLGYLFSVVNVVQMWVGYRHPQSRVDFTSGIYHLTRQDPWKSH